MAGRFNAKRVNGFDSQYEQTVFECIKAAGVVPEYHPPGVPYQLSAVYVPDFRVGDIYLEIKGYFDQDQRRKMAAVREARPDLDIRILFQNRDRNIPGGEMLLSKWCQKYRIKCAFRTMPDDWLEEMQAQTTHRSKT